MATSVAVKIKPEFVTELPGTLVKDTLYFLITPGNTFTLHMLGGATAVQRALAAAPLPFDRYDMTIATTTAAMDITKNQWFKVDLSLVGGAAVNMTITAGSPALTRGMVIILETLSNKRSLVLPASVVVLPGVDTTPGVVRSFYTIVYNGSTYTLISNTKVDA